jgi:hypothetical protein
VALTGEMAATMMVTAPIVMPFIFSPSLAQFNTLLRTRAGAIAARDG